jgi:hypothetical protein
MNKSLYNEDNYIREFGAVPMKDRKKCLEKRIKHLDDELRNINEEMSKLSKLMLELTDEK